MKSTDLTRRGALAAVTGAAAACGVQNVETPPYDGVVAFNHGVASGDPQADRVIIWTRVSPEQPGPVPVRWILARNRDLTDVVKTGVIETSEARDYTVKADVTGLRAGAPYFYGFRAGAAESGVGKTSTLPRGRLEQLKLGVVSCASFPHGFFNAYEALAARGDLDAIVHLGDYIYEYGLSGYGGDVATQLGRIPSPEVECIRLADYRARHAQYKTEAELQAAHAAAPWIVVWDDHETANDSWSTGAENHQADEGEWSSRKQAALQAYYEWMPIRDPEPGRAFEAINRSFQFGDLASLIMVETRLLARSRQLDYATQLPIEMQRWNVSNPNAPVALRDHEPDVAAMRLLPRVYEAVGDEMRPVLDWRRAQGLAAHARDLPAGFFLAPDVAAIDALLRDPDRQMMGAAQEEWLAGELSGSVAAGRRWQVLGNQVLVAPVNAPDLSATPPALAAALERLSPGVTQLLKLTRFAFPASTDTWDGYPAARDRLLAAIRQAQANVVVITGDSHTAWANELNDAEGRVATEFGATSITSPSDADYFVSAGVDFAGGVQARNPHVKYVDPIHRGFLVLTLTQEAAQADFFSVSTITSKQYETARTAAFRVTSGSGVIAAE
ncbi:MAG: alkaline phosphatase D family protein [Hyphomonadaceae bacterium]